MAPQNCAEATQRAPLISVPLRSEKNERRVPKTVNIVAHSRTKRVQGNISEPELPGKSLTAKMVLNGKAAKEGGIPPVSNTINNVLESDINLPQRSPH